MCVGIFNPFLLNPFKLPRGEGIRSNSDYAASLWVEPLTISTHRRVVSFLAIVGLDSTHVVGEHLHGRACLAFDSSGF